jgi:hypothetical protein
MFPGRYFAARYFAPRYFAKVGADPLPSTGGGTLMLLGIGG